MEKFPSDVFRDYNNLIDYRTEQQTGARFYRCYNPDGNVFDLYKTGAYRGRLFLKDTLEHEITIKIFDSYENSALLKFTVKGENITPAVPSTEEVPFIGNLTADMQDLSLIRI